MRSDDCTAAWADWLNDFVFISSRALPSAQPPSPCPVTLNPPSHYLYTPSRFNAVTLHTPIPVSTISHLHWALLQEPLCLVKGLQQWLPPNLHNSHFHKRSQHHNHREKRRQDTFSLFSQLSTSSYQGLARQSYYNQVDRVEEHICDAIGHSAKAVSNSLKWVSRLKS